MGFNEDEGKGVGVGEDVMLYLQHLCDTSITVEVGLSIKDFNDNKVYDCIRVSKFDKSNWSQEYGGLPSRQKLLNKLIRKVLVMEVRMRISDFPLYPFIPQNPSACETLQKLFMDKETADVVFEVGGKYAQDESRMKISKAESTQFVAHSAILKRVAPILAELCHSDVVAPSIFQIPNESPETFHHLLHYIYGRDIPDFGADVSHLKEIIVAADRFGITNLKLEAEAYYVSSATITVQNVMDHLLFADSKNLALLKEKAIEYIVENSIEIMRRKVINDAPGHLMNDILALTTRINKKAGGYSFDDIGMEALSISELRRIAHNFDIDVDGSREMLVSALQKSWGITEDNE